MSRYANFSEAELIDLLAEYQMAGSTRKADDIRLELWHRNVARVTIAIDEEFRLVVMQPDEFRTGEVYEVFTESRKPMGRAETI